MAQKKLQRNEKKLYFCGVKINELNMNNSFFGISLNAIGESRRDYQNSESLTEHTVRDLFLPVELRGLKKSYSFAIDKR